MNELMKIHGIKCDNPSCSYEDDSVTFDKYESFVNYPCPLCGDNLLTEQDFKTVKLLRLIFNNPVMRFINWFFGLFSKKEPETIEIEMNGTGNFKVKE